MVVIAWEERRMMMMAKVGVAAKILLLSLTLFFLMETTGANFDFDEWSVWSEWSPCSRTCDGGVTQQIRKCISVQGCNGVSIRRKMCNMQPCSEFRDYRTEQCKANKFDGAIEDPENPCKLICQKFGSDGYVKADIRNNIRDGTRCKSGALHVCIEGKCESVGCDLKIGSPKKVDECGVCGGNGSSCTTTMYRWEIIPSGPCSANCGGGQRIVNVICRSLTMEKVDQSLCNSSQKPYRTSQTCNTKPCEPNWQVGEWTPCSKTCDTGVQQRKIFCVQDKNGTKVTVNDKLCHHVRKPPNQEDCFLEPCPIWYIGPWSACSTSCGKGYITRSVTCRTAKNEPATNCPGTKPPDTKRCSEMTCPSTSTTTTMSTTTTTITSTSKSFAPTVTIVATKVSTPPTANKPGRKKTTMRLEISSTQSPATTTLPKYQYRNNIISNYLVYPTASAVDDAGAEDWPQEHTLPLIQPYPPMDNAVLFDQNAIPSEPTKVRVYFACGWLFLSFVAEEWGPCSSTCGEGTKRRDVKCKIFLEFSRTIATLPDKECPGPKPSETETCINLPCPPATDKAMDDWKPHYPHDGPSDWNMRMALADSAALSADSYSYDAPKGKFAGLPPGINMQDMAYSWKVQGYSPCSAPCLGGIQEAIVHCLRDFDGRLSTPQLCGDNPPPDFPTTRTCNDHVCLPRWNVSDFGACSKSCGGGVMTRDVNCIHEVTRGNTVIVPNGICAPPVPRTEMLCNTVSCPTYWEPGDWSRCSKECGQGKRTRQIHCKQVIALGQVVEWSNPEGHCTMPRPADTRPCKKKPCSNRKPLQSISPTPFTYIQSEWKQKLTLRVKGEAKVFHGVSPLRLHCPAGKDVDRSRVIWMKGHEYLADIINKINRSNKNKIQVLNKNEKAVLKIHNLTYSDSGIYTCLFNQRPISNLTLAVVPFVGTREMRSSRNNIHHFHDSRLLADQQLVASEDNEREHHNHNHNSHQGHHQHDHDESSSSVVLRTPTSKLFLSASSSSSRLKAPFFFLRDISLIKRIFTF